MTKITTEQIMSAVEILATIALIIKKSGSIPAGTLYAQVMGRLSHSQFESCMDTLVGAKIIKRQNHLLTYIAEGDLDAGVERMGL